MNSGNGTDAMTMRAMIVPRAGAPFEAAERPLPDPGPGEVRIRVQACGVWRGDALVVEGRMPGLSYPRIPGHEVIGTIEASGSGVAGWPIHRQGRIDSGLNRNAYPLDRRNADSLSLGVSTVAVQVALKLGRRV